MQCTRKVSNVLDAKLIMLLSTLVGPFQHTFAKQQQAFGAVLIVIEVVDSYLNNEEGGVICK